MFPLWLILVIVLLLILAAGLVWWGLKKAVILALNSVVGFFALYAVQAFVMPSLQIRFWSVIITAIGGIFGFAIIVILHVLGIAF